jgi:hypothetical protein
MLARTESASSRWIIAGVGNAGAPEGLSLETDDLKIELDKKLPAVWGALRRFGKS